MKEEPKQTDIESIIQKDLDNGKFYSICSNETTFKDYVFQKLSDLEQSTREKIIKEVRENLISEIVNNTIQSNEQMRTIRIIRNYNFNK